MLGISLSEPIIVPNFADKGWIVLGLSLCFGFHRLLSAFSEIIYLFMSMNKRKGLSNVLVSV